MKRGALLVAALSALCTLAFALANAAPWEAPPGSAIPATLVALFAASPWLPLLAAAMAARRTLQSGVALAGSVLSALLGLCVYVDAFVWREEPLRALLFLAVPMAQWGIGLASLLAVVALRLIDRAAHPASSELSTP